MKFVLISYFSSLKLLNAFYCKYLIYFIIIFVRFDKIHIVLLMVLLYDEIMVSILLIVFIKFVDSSII
jgi:hypothetical protein